MLRERRPRSAIAPPVDGHIVAHAGFEAPERIEHGARPPVTWVFQAKKRWRVGDAEEIALPGDSASSRRGAVTPRRSRGG